MVHQPIHRIFLLISAFRLHPLKVVGDWLGNDAAFAHVFSSVIDMQEHGALLIQNMAAEMLDGPGDGSKRSQSG